MTVSVTSCFIGPPTPPWMWNEINTEQKESLVFDVNNSDAKVLWETSSTPALYYSETGKIFISADPIMSRSGILYLQGSEDMLKAINPQTGGLITTYTIEDPFTISSAYNNDDEIVIGVINKSKDSSTKSKMNLLYFIVINEKLQKVVAFTYGKADELYALYHYLYTYYTNNKIIDLWQHFEELDVWDAKTDKLLWSSNPSTFSKPVKVMAAYTYDDIVYGLIDPDDNKHFIVKAYKLSDGEPIWETTFDKTETIKGYSMQMFKNKFLLVEGQYTTKGKDIPIPGGGKIMALHLSDGTIAWQRDGYVANYPHIKNTIYIVAPHSNNTLEVVSPENGATITSASIEDNALLLWVFETSDGFLYVSKDFGYLNHRNKCNLSLTWSFKIGKTWNWILTDIHDDTFTFDAPYSSAYEYGKLSYIWGVHVGLTDTTFAADATTGKILWKARIEGDNPIVVRTVLARNNMAFIKTAAGNVFAVKWENKKQ